MALYLTYVIQELIQNAEDASASRIVFMLDHTSYPAGDDRLHDEALAQHQVSYCDQVTAVYRQQ